MSELKAFTFGLGQYTECGSPCVVAFDGEKNPRLASDEKFYLKSEADKVIAEKDTKIIQLEALIENYNRISGEIIDNANHQKYRRCLAMARWCASRSASWCLDPADEQLHKSDFYDKWKKRWLELAEKFKEVK